MNLLWKKLAAMHSANKEALETNKSILEAANVQAGEIAEIKARAEEQAVKLCEANRRNHYSESLTHAFRGNPA